MNNSMWHTFVLIFLFALDVNAQKHFSIKVKYDTVNEFKIEKEDFVFRNKLGDTYVAPPDTVRANIIINEDKIFTVDLSKAYLRNDTLYIHLKSAVNPAFYCEYDIKVFQGNFLSKVIIKNPTVEYQVVEDTSLKNLTPQEIKQNRIASGKRHQEEDEVKPLKMSLLLNKTKYRKGDEIRGFASFEGMSKTCIFPGGVYYLKGNFKAIIK